MKNLLVATATAFMFSLTASYAIVAPEQETPKRKFLGNFAGAMVASFKCKSWKINTPEVELLMGYLHITTKDISPEGPDWPVFQRDMLRAENDTKDFDANAVCSAAEGMFGPKGTVAPNLMIHAESDHQ